MSLAEDFNTERTRLEGQRQESKRQAWLAFCAANDAAHADHDAELEKLRGIFQQAQGTEVEDQARAAFEAVPLEPTGLRAISDALDATIRKIDEQYHTDVRAAAARLGISSEG